MLPASERISRRSVFQRAYSLKKKVSSEYLTVYVIPRQAGSQRALPFCGFVVSKKVDARAVRRNRTRRKVREVYRFLTNGLRFNTDLGNLEELSELTRFYALVWVVNQDLSGCEFNDLIRNVKTCLVKAINNTGRAPGRPQQA